MTLELLKELLQDEKYQGWTVAEFVEAIKKLDMWEELK